MSPKLVKITLEHDQFAEVDAFTAAEQEAFALADEPLRKMDALREKAEAEDAAPSQTTVAEGNPDGGAVVIFGSINMDVSAVAPNLELPNLPML